MATRKTPLTIITGSLGSGKTTFLKHILDNFPCKIAILINEFGEINIDSKIIKGKNIQMTELQGGCVCCSLIGEFEAAIVEIIEKINPDYIIVETTGIAEPDALIFDVQESLPMIRMDGVVTVVDADLMLRFPQLGHTTKMQIVDADLLALNKLDLVTHENLDAIEQQLKRLNPHAPILRTEFCRIDPELIFGISRAPQKRPLPHKHQPEYTSFSYKTDILLNRQAFQNFSQTLPDTICRAKGFVNFREGTFLWNFVNGRGELEPHEQEETALVFIGKNYDKDSLINRLNTCLPYKYLEDSAIADIAFEVTGSSLEELFQSAADAVTNVMVRDLKTIAMHETRHFKEENKEIDLLLFDFLQEIIFYKDSAQVLLRAPEVKIEKNGALYCLEATFKGECLNPEKHEQHVDVKAVTLHQFVVEKRSKAWFAHVVLDI